MDDRDAIYGTVYQGARPSAGPGLAAAGFKALVLCAAEFQPPASDFPGVRLIRCPIEEEVPDERARRSLTRAAVRAAEFARRGELVLISCHAGVNRSSLVTGLVIHALTGMSGGRITQVIREGRPKALSSRTFLKLVSRIGLSTP